MSSAFSPEPESFDFIDDEILRKNLEQISSHIRNLQFLAFLDTYPPEEQSSFRKTVIIYTAAQIEAVLLWYLRYHKTEEECATTEHTFRIDQHIYQLSDTERIVRGSDVSKTQKFKFSNVNLAQIIHLCTYFELLPEHLASQIQEIRKLRNRQHVGGLDMVDQDYTNEDVVSALQINEEVIEYVKHQVACERE
jgi:hypothetical protein